MVLREGFGALTRGQQTVLNGKKFPIPLLGVNAVSAFSDLLPNEAHYLYNILPTPQGLKVRKGTKEYSNDTGYKARTTISFVDKAESGAGDKVFCTGQDGIYEMVAGAAAATKVFTFTTTGVTAGYGNYIQWTAANGDQYLQYADSANGLLEYDANADSWSAVTSITGLTETNIRFVTVHKLRIWYLLENDPNGYYLPVDAKTGAATQFQLGSKFRYGSDCAGIWNMSHDAGDGLDDFFIAISRAGDVLVYQGSDPSSASTWALKGRWQIGAVPTGRKFAEEISGDVLILSAFGLSSCKQLLEGKETYEIKTRSPMDKISNLIRNRMVLERSTEGWEIMIHPSGGVLVIQTPERTGSIDRWLHYVYDLNTQAWGFWRNVKSTSMAVLRDILYYGNSDGELWFMTGTQDAITLADPSGSPEPIDFSGLTAYSDCDLPGLYKRGSVVKAFFRGEDLEAYDYKIMYDYDFAELTAPTDEGSPTNVSEWDTAEWDSAIWVGNVNYDEPFGTLGGGMGVALAIAFRGNSRGDNTLMEMNLTYESGGYI